MCASVHTHTNNTTTGCFLKTNALRTAGRCFSAAPCDAVSKLTLGGLGCEHGVIVAFSVAGDFDGKELNPGG